MLLSAMLAIVASTAGAVPAADPDHGPFAYAMTKTPEEGPVDPAVANRYSKAWHACSEAAAPPGLDACFREEFMRQDAALNHAWPLALPRIPRSSRPALIAAQRRWIAARDPFCRAFANGLRGSLAATAYLDCRIELTIRRTIWLEALPPAA